MTPTFKERAEKEAPGKKIKQREPRAREARGGGWSLWGGGNRGVRDQRASREKPPVAGTAAMRPEARPFGPGTGRQWLHTAHRWTKHGRMGAWRSPLLKGSLIA